MPLYNDSSSSDSSSFASVSLDAENNKPEPVQKKSGSQETEATTFENMFFQAGLEDNASVPSGASTDSGSSISERVPPTKISMKSPPNHAFQLKNVPNSSLSSGVASTNSTSSSESQSEANVGTSPTPRGIDKPQTSLEQDVDTKRGESDSYSAASESDSYASAKTSHSETKLVTTNNPQSSEISRSRDINSFQIVSNPGSPGFASARSKRSTETNSSDSTNFRPHESGLSGVSSGPGSGGDIKHSHSETEPTSIPKSLLSAASSNPKNRRGWPKVSNPGPASLRSASTRSAYSNAQSRSAASSKPSANKISSHSGEKFDIGSPSQPVSKRRSSSGSNLELGSNLNLQQQNSLKGENPNIELEQKNRSVSPEGPPSSRPKALMQGLEEERRRALEISNSKSGLTSSSSPKKGDQINNLKTKANASQKKFNSGDNPHGKDVRKAAKLPHKIGISTATKDSPSIKVGGTNPKAESSSKEATYSHVKDISKPPMLPDKTQDSTFRMEIDKTDHVINNTVVFKKDTSGENEWMPPAWTRYEKPKYLPTTTVKEVKKMDPPSLGAVIKQSPPPKQPKPNGNVEKKELQQSKNVAGAKKQDDAPPPVFEISVLPPEEDESSLGSMGWLFTLEHNTKKAYLEAKKTAERKPEIKPPVKNDNKASKEVNANDDSWDPKAAKVSLENDKAPARNENTQNYKKSESPGHRKLRTAPIARPPAERSKSVPKAPAPRIGAEEESWVAKIPNYPRVTAGQNIARQDPPGMTRPRPESRFVHHPVTNHQQETPVHQKVAEKVPTNPKLSSIPTPNSLSNKHTASITLAAKPRRTSEWGSWVLNPNKKVTQAPVVSRTARRSNVSVGSDWMPPHTPSIKKSPGESKSSLGRISKSSSSGSRSGSSGSRTKSSRVDFTGAVNSQPGASNRVSKVKSKPKKNDESQSSLSGSSGASSLWRYSEGSGYSSTGLQGSLPILSGSPQQEKGPSVPGSSSELRSQTTNQGSDSRLSGQPDAVHSASESAPHEHSGSTSEKDSKSSVSERESVSISERNSRSTSKRGSGSMFDKELEGMKKLKSYKTEESVRGTPSSRSVSVVRPETLGHDVEQAINPASKGENPGKKKKSAWTNICFCVLLSVLVAGVVVAVLFKMDKIELETKDPPSPQSPSEDPQDLMSFIVSLSPNSEDSLKDQSSAQRKAFDWLQENQLFGSYSRSRKLQQFVLATLYFETKGPSWENLDLWLSETSECDWYTSEPVLEICSDQEELNEIDLHENGLNGVLPWQELSILDSQLMVMDFHNNQLQGQIPNLIEEFQAIIYLNLHGNAFTGTIPRNIEKLTNMRYLDLGNNLLSGTIPKQIYKMKNLQTIRLDINNLSGTISSRLGELSNLKNLYLVSILQFSDYCVCPLLTGCCFGFTGREQFCW